MTKIPVISGRECVAALQRAGFVFVRQKGSHIVLRRDDPYARVVVPNHSTVDRGTLHTIIRDAKLTVEEFVQLLD